jgi:DNA-binding NtrC family response regulator
MIKPYIVVIDDEISQDSPLAFELKQKYGQTNVHLFVDSQEGLKFLLNNLEKRLIVLLDIRMPEKDGRIILQELRKKTELIPVIIWSAYNGKDYDFTDFVKNHAFDIIPKGYNPDEIIAVVDRAILATSTNIDASLEEWLEKQDNKDDIMLVTKSGNTYTANQLINEVRQQTAEGKRLVNNINALTINLLFRGKEKID